MENYSENSRLKTHLRDTASKGSSIEKRHKFTHSLLSAYSGTSGTLSLFALSTQPLLAHQHGPGIPDQDAVRFQWSQRIFTICHFLHTNRAN